MIHLRNRDDLIDLVGRCPRKTIQRLVERDRVECLGQFLPGVAPGDSRVPWLFDVQGYSGKHYIVAALFKNYRDVGYRVLKEVPWHLWNGEYGLKGGDNPGKYALKRADALRSMNNVKTDAKDRA